MVARRLEHLRFLSGNPLVVDGNLITSRKPDDRPAFCREIVKALART